MGESEAEVLAWCVVANVAEQTSHGANAELQRGLRHFSAGAKLWVLPPQWGDGGLCLFVIGRHRGPATADWRGWWWNADTSPTSACAASTARRSTGS